MNNPDKKEVFRTWRVRKRLKDGGMCAVCQFEYAGSPMSAKTALSMPDVIEWIGEDTLDDIYHPDLTP